MLTILRFITLLSCHHDDGITILIKRYHHTCPVACHMTDHMIGKPSHMMGKPSHMMGKNSHMMGKHSHMMDKPSNHHT